MRAVRIAALGFFAALHPQAQADAPAVWVGTWYTETARDGERAGKKYDMFRVVAQNRADGTKTNVFRFYAAGAVVAEETTTYRWGVDGNMYWTECRTVIRGSQSETCSWRQDYDVVSVTTREMRYRSRSTGTVFSMIRVKDDFKLP